MSSSRLSLRPSPSRPKSSGRKAALLPAQIPLPPSPPASDGIEDPFGPQSPQRASSRRVSPRAKTSASRQPVPQPPRRRSTHLALEAVVESKQDIGRTRSRKRCVLADQLDSSSPPTSPTNRKSARTTKRVKLSQASPACRSPPSSPIRAPRDTPNNPFLVKAGEKPRRAGARRDEEHRKLVYVFRGKRIPYDTTEDLNHAGGSPFGSSCPKLLFPSPPSPGPARKLKFTDEDEIFGGSGGGGQMSPSRANQRDRTQLGYQTPKRDNNKAKNRPDGSHMLPTPQSRPRRSVVPPASSSRQVLAHPVKTGKTMAKAMR
ncbi:hypothetical protein PTTG_29471 [Puccinia triticina 1-1 BBBD Race 1]|uniref:Uncharacterized protein n=1 Tax=Puccinia triticina (isolate 1-1 / race 1 (BBBD)) TaxID=630390 RepID=A0A180G3W8_PUCT1|nr:hypothetical protein PTTG_29471 [Puccinia triticina 1-1 BBBD Race 1]